MLELAGGEGLRVDVGELLQLEGALLRDRGAGALAEADDRVLLREQLRGLRALRRAVVDRLPHRERQLPQRVDERRAQHLVLRVARRVEQPLAVRDPDRHQRQHDDLARERLRRRDRDLAPAVQVDPAVDVARDLRADRVHAPDREHAVRLRDLERVPQVRSLARLRHADEPSGSSRQVVPSGQRFGRVSEMINIR